jgi:hypothetical protein
MPLILFNIAWMKEYAGLPDDQPLGFSEAPGFGELLNFAPMRGRMYGWVQTTSLDLERLGAPTGADRMNRVTVVWTATKPGGGKVVIGVYNDASIFAEPQRHAKPRLRSQYGTIQDYIATARREDCICIDVADRTFGVGRGPGLPGQSPVWYADSDRAETKELLNRLQPYLASLQKMALANVPTSTQPAPVPRGRGGMRRPLDPAVRKEVEEAAVNAFNAFAMARYKGKVIRDAQKDNLGWDAEVYPKGYITPDRSTASDAEYLIEIKGNSGSIPSADLTPNEYKMLKLHWERYRLAIVTDAITAPKVNLFQPLGTSCDNWEDEAGEQIALKEITGARLS